MPAAVAVPLISAGIGAGASIYSSHKTSSQMQKASQLSPEGVAARQGLMQQGGKLNTAGSGLMRQGQGLVGQGANTLQDVRGYWNPLLRGDRAQVDSALAPDVAGITDVYRGAGRNLERSGVQGAQRAEQAGELNRQRAGQLALLRPQMRAQAASALAGLGGQQLQTGQGLAQTGAGLYGQGAQAYGAVYGGERGSADQAYGSYAQTQARNDQSLGQGLGGITSTIGGIYASRPQVQRPIPTAPVNRPLMPYPTAPIQNRP